MVCHAFWSYQHPFHFPTFYEWHFSDLLDIHVIVYLDDILIFSNNPTDHKNMFVKYSDDFVLMVSMYVLTNVSFLWIQLTTLDSSFHEMDWRWIPAKYKQSQTGLNPGKLKIYNLSLVLQTSIDVSFPTIPLLSSCW